MVKKVPQDRKEAEAWTATKALTDTQDPREKGVTQAHQERQPTPHIHLWPKVPEVSPDSQEPLGSQEPGGSPETPAHQACLARPSEMKMRREACPARWAPKATRESRAPPRCTPAHQEPTESRASAVPRDPLDPLDQTISCSASKAPKAAWATLGLPVSRGLAARKVGKVTPATVNAQRMTNSSGVSPGRQDPRAFQASTGSRGGKGAKATRASTAFLDSQASREPPVTLGPPGPKE